MPVDKDKLSGHFRSSEFMCHCCGLSVPHPGLVLKLEQFRHIVNRPIIITCGTRCLSHNKVVSAHAKTSWHLPDKDRDGGDKDGLCSRAADIVVVGMHPVDTARHAAVIFNGVGLYKTFVHVDVRGYNASWYGINGKELKITRSFSNKEIVKCNSQVNT